MSVGIESQSTATLQIPEKILPKLIYYSESEPVTNVVINEAGVYAVEFEANAGIRQTGIISVSNPLSESVTRYYGGTGSEALVSCEKGKIEVRSPDQLSIYAVYRIAAYKTNS